MSFELPPHIKLTEDGKYVSTRTSRFIPEKKIEDICNKYWGNDIVIKDDRNNNHSMNENLQELPDEQPAVVDRRIVDLRNILFNQLDKLKNCAGMQLQEEAKRATSMVEVAKTIIDSTRAETEFLRTVNDLKDTGMVTGFISKQMHNEGLFEMSGRKR